MKIGDKVRLLRGTEEGRIVNFKKGNIIEIEIEDGFVIPALKNEVVVIDKGETETFQREEPGAQSIETSNNAGTLPDGVYLGFADEGNAYTAHLINHTEEVILFTFSHFDGKVLQGKSYGICKDNEVFTLGSFPPGMFDKSNKLIIQVITFERQTRIKKQPLHLELILRNDLLKEISYLPSIDKHVRLVKIEEKPLIQIDPQQLKTSMLEKNKGIPDIKKPKQQKELTVDLHIEALAIDLNPNEILEHQLNEFEIAYDNALVMNTEKLKIIHGVGAGILRNEIHKRLSRKSEVKYFEDADKERFGFGATIIYF